MRAIGIRVEPKQICYTIIFENNEWVNESLIVPKALDTDTPRQLSFIRTTLHSIIKEHDIKLAGLRTAEGSARTIDRFRITIEGVIQELLSDSEIKYYFTGTLNSISSRLDTDVKLIRECINHNKNAFEVHGWDSLNKNERESFLTALAAKKRGILNDRSKTG